MWHHMAKNSGQESCVHRPWVTGFCPALPYQKASEVSWEITVRVISVFFVWGVGALVRVG